MNTDGKKKLLSLLVDLQESCGPIEIKIGTTRNNVVTSDTIVILEAPPIVVQKLIENGYDLDITKEGVIVYKYS